MTPPTPGSQCPGDPTRNIFSVGRIMLQRPAGEQVRLHRFLGRWLILRVTEAVDGDLLPKYRRDVDGVAINVIVDPASIRGEHGGFCDTIALDHEGCFRQCFPGLRWPVIFIIDPAGELVAILSDIVFEPFMQSLVRDGRGSPSARPVNAIDRGDLYS